MRKQMENDSFAIKRKQNRGQAKGWYEKLADDDLEKEDENFDQLFRVLQGKFRSTRLHAEQEYKKRTE